MSLLKKLAETGWGANFTTLRTSTLALAFFTAEYASPAWNHTSHVHTIDTVLNSNGAMRLISGALIVTPVSNLPVLSGISPAQLRRGAQTTKLAKKHDEDNCLVPAPTTFTDQRLSRRHFATQAAEMPLDRAPSTIPSTGWQTAGQISGSLQPRARALCKAHLAVTSQRMHGSISIA